MSIITISFNPVSGGVDDLVELLTDGIVKESRAVLNKQDNNYSATELFEAAAALMTDHCKGARIKWVDDDVTPSCVWLTLCWPGVSADVIEDRVENKMSLDVYTEVWSEDAWLSH